MTRRRKKTSPPLWQWILIILIAVLLYHGLNTYLIPNKGGHAKKDHALKLKQNSTEEAPPATAEKEKEAPDPFAYESLKKRLPNGAYPDNYKATKLAEKNALLLSYAKIKPKVEPGPQGLTRTQPGLRLLRLKDGDFQISDLDFQLLKSSLGSLPIEKLTGPPTINPKPIVDEKVKIFEAKIFLEEDPREVLAYFLVDEDGPHWAKLKHASGKKILATFANGTTKNLTRQVWTQKYSGKIYIVVETGILEEFRAFAGYRWHVESYFWNGYQFVYDATHSAELTKEKRGKKVSSLLALAGSYS